jgi:hypothetical protein
MVSVPSIEKRRLANTRFDIGGRQAHGGWTVEDGANIPSGEVVGSARVVDVEVVDKR